METQSSSYKSAYKVAIYTEDFEAASITIQKVEELCKLLPALNSEINWERGASKKSKDDVQYIFKNGSILDILPARESSRGQRRTGRKKFFRLWSFL